MKNFQNKKLAGVIALFSASFLGGFAVLASKVLLRELPPLTILFLRLTIMSLVLIPLAVQLKGHLFAYVRKLIILSMLWTGNLLFFIVGIQYSTAIMSGLLYAATPILVVLGNYLFHRIKMTRLQAIGISFGFIGTTTIIVRSFAPGESLGSAMGNFLLVAGVVSYTLFLLYSKQLSVHVSPLGLTASIAVLGWATTGVVMIILEGVSGVTRLPMLSPQAWLALLFVGTGLGVVMYFLNQWGIKHATALAAGMSLYIGTLTTTVTGIVFLSERLTIPIVTGGVLLLSGVYISTILPLQKARKPSFK